jgi:hypothetical protein
MARRGDIVENPMTGERTTFLETARDTGGELLRFEYVLPPGWSVPEHVHPRQEERHEIVSGTLSGCVGDRNTTSGKGRWWSARRVCPTPGETPATTRSCALCPSYDRYCIWRLSSRPAPASRGT